MQNVSALKPLFRQYNLPNPETLTPRAVEVQLEELSEAVEAIERQLEERSEPLEGMTEKDLQAWRSRAIGAVHIKNKQIDALGMLAKKAIEQEIGAGYIIRKKPHPLADNGHSSDQPVRYFSPEKGKEVEIEEVIETPKKDTARSSRATVLPNASTPEALTATTVGNKPTKESPKATASPDQFQTEIIEHLAKCLKLLEKVVEEEEVALFSEEIKVIIGANNFLTRAKLKQSIE